MSFEFGQVPVSRHSGTFAVFGLFGLLALPAVADLGRPAVLADHLARAREGDHGSANALAWHRVSLAGDLR